jgi:tetratricopeptide (TPR) repeat protein
LKHAKQLLDTAPDSALIILQHFQPLESLTDADRALYGILLFQALDKNNLTLQPDSTINFSANYYLQKNKKRELAISYYYKARLYKTAQRFDDATLLFLKALDIFQNSDEYYYLGKIYSDMGDICSFQKDYKESLYKYQLSNSYFQKANNTIEACYKLIDIGRIHRFLKEPKKAFEYYNKALTQTKDSFVCGAAYQEIGVNFFNEKKFKLSNFYLKKSLEYPYRGTSYSIRCYVLGDVYYELNKYDSAVYFSQLAFKYPTTFIIQRECYRILANTEYNQGDFNNARIYMGKYQDCTDSVRKIEIQTKSTVLEDFHETNDAYVKSKYFLLALSSIILLITLMSLFIFNQLRKRNRNKEQLLETIEKKLMNKQALLKESLIKKIEEKKLSKTPAYKKATLSERELIDKEVYTVCLYLNEWTSFEKLMNETFNNLFVVLKEKCSDINRKELIMCSLYLLDIPTNDMIIILDCQQGSLYTLKHRLSQKFKLSGAKELEQLLLNLSSEN